MPAFKVFLSHRYESPEVNLFFYGLFSKHAELHFEVDQKKGSTNVTRLERMIRGADAFVGIYPFPAAVDEVPTREALLHESRYFRLEIDLAIRSEKPALIFYDQRYQNWLLGTNAFATCAFDPQEVSTAAAIDDPDSVPNAARFQNIFISFCASVTAGMNYHNQNPVQREARVGILLPPGNASGGGYEAEHFAAIETLLAASSYEVTKLKWPPKLDRDFHNAATSVDWAIADVGDPESAAAVAFLHGQFVPTMRLKRTAGGDLQTALERTLYGAYEVGYTKDTVRWEDTDTLRTGVASRIDAIDRLPKRISKRKDAEDYFRSPSLRKEEVFLSYCGRDADAGAQISAALKKRFEKVFDYKDGESIRPGMPWLDDIFDRLSAAAVFVPLLSNAYFQSGNCLHEAEKAVQIRDGSAGTGRLRIIPVKLDGEKLDLPPWFTSLQYERNFAIDHDADALAQRILDNVKTHG